jgi:hypothetical protein
LLFVGAVNEHSQLLRRERRKMFVASWINISLLKAQNFPLCSSVYISLEKQHGKYAQWNFPLLPVRDSYNATIFISNCLSFSQEQWHDRRGYGLDNRGIIIRLPERASDFSLFQSVQAHPVSYWIPWFFSGQGEKITHLHPVPRLVLSRVMSSCLAQRQLTFYLVAEHGYTKPITFSR